MDGTQMFGGCVACGGPSGVVCGVCASRYCPHCWMVECEDHYSGVYLCHRCEAALPSRADTLFVVNVEDDNFDDHKLIIHGGPALLQLFDRCETGLFRVTASQDYGHTRRFLEGKEDELQWCE